MSDRSVADRKLRRKTEPRKTLNDRALKLIISHRIKLAGRADLRSLDALARLNALFFDCGDRSAELARGDLRRLIHQCATPWPRQCNDRTPQNLTWGFRQPFCQFAPKFRRDSQGRCAGR